MAEFVESLGWNVLTRISLQGRLLWAGELGVVVALLVGLSWLALRRTRRAQKNPRSLKLALAVMAVALVYVYAYTGLRGGLIVSPIYRLQTTKKVIALTFDDGPKPDFTPKILDVLKDKDVPATFFLLAPNVRRNSAIAQRIQAEGHVIASHGSSHKSMQWMRYSRVEQDLEDFERAASAAGLRPLPLFRPPFGAKSPLVELCVRRRGMLLVTWTLTPKDWRGDPPDVLLSRMEKVLEPGAIILLHDAENTAGFLGPFIDFARQRGYKFVRVSEYLPTD